MERIRSLELHVDLSAEVLRRELVEVERHVADAVTGAEHRALADSISDTSARREVGVIGSDAEPLVHFAATGNQHLVVLDYIARLIAGVGGRRVWLNLITQSVVDGQVLRHLPAVLRVEEVLALPEAAELEHGGAPDLLRQSE